MTSAVIIVLREVLEAMLLICILMASSNAMGFRLRWLVPAVITGLVGALTYALLIGEISMLFGGFGQELINALLLVMISMCLVAHNFIAVKRIGGPLPEAYRHSAMGLMAAAIAMAMLREGAEIYLYVYAYGVTAGEAPSVLSGSAIGVGIGFSIGTFVYYGLKMLPGRRCLQACCAISLIVAAGVMSEAARYLVQADILPASEALWDSSGFLSESSLVGELLHASIGYEDRPTLPQVTMYVGSVLMSVVVMLAAHLSSRRHPGNTTASA